MPHHQTHPSTAAEDSSAGTELEIVGCPQCGLPAIVEWRTSVGSTAGPMEHVKVRCVDRHWFLMPAAKLSE